MAMPYYALYYFRKSAYLQPTDSRLWIAMAQCYETDQLHMLEEAVKCYKRAAHNIDTEGIAIHRLAKLHSKLGCNDQAAIYCKMNFEKMEAKQRGAGNACRSVCTLH
ncbi:hypothetical protein AMTRI_Chr13g90640 [Amborella trichopoda]